MRVRPEIGRFFSSAERDDTQNVHAVAVISHRFWSSHYGLDRSAIGATIRINRTPFTIIGVAPEGFHGSAAGLDFEVWLPVTMYGQLTHTGTWMLRDRGTRNFLTMGRLKPGVTMEQARGEIRASPGACRCWTPTRIRASARSPAGVEGALLAPGGAAGADLHFDGRGLPGVVDCLRQRGEPAAGARHRPAEEFGVRLALGAGPARLARQLLVETLLLALAGSAAGLVIASWLSGSLRWLLPAVSTPAVLAPQLNGGVLLFTTALAFVVAILTGVGPALLAARSNMNDILKEAGRSAAAGLHSHRLRGLLVVSEVALAVVALVGAGLFLKSFQESRAIRPGFDPEGVALARFDFSTAGYNAAETDAFSARLRESLEPLPGVTAVSYDDSPPLGFDGGNWEPLDVEGYVPGRSENMKIYRDMVSPGYFHLMKIPLLEGRDFDLRDGRAATKNGPNPLKVTIVNQEFARRFFAGRDPIGRKVHGWGEWFTVVGVVGNIKYHHLTESPQPFFYIPIRQVYRPEYGLNFQVRTAGPVAEAIAAIRRQTAAIDPALPIFDSLPMTEYISASLFGQKIGAVLLSVLGSLGLLMAALGLYGVMAHWVAQRTGEIGIRMTLGAEPRDVMRLVLSQGLGFALTGLAVGLAAAAALARLAAALLGPVSSADPTVYAGAAVFTVAIALLSAAIPARRALGVDPMVAMRGQ